MDNVEKPKEQAFSDLYLIAALLSYSPLSYGRVDKTKPGRQLFYFHDNVLEVYIMSPEGPKKVRTPTLQQIQNWYTAGILVFMPNYPECIKRIKTEVHT